MNEHPSAFECAIYMDALGFSCLCLEEKKEREGEKRRKGMWKYKVMLLQL